LSIPLDSSFFDPLQKVSSCPNLGDWKSAAAGDTCSTENSNNFFSDPLYESMEWMFDLIHVRPVWEQGYTGAGIHVRINDDGVDPDHPEFEARYDVENSCADYLPINGTESHGTACASIILGEANNDVCAVGIAPGATVSSCSFAENLDITDAESESLEATMLGTKLEAVDISSNSWGPVPVS